MNEIYVVGTNSGSVYFSKQLYKCTDANSRSHTFSAIYKDFRLVGWLVGWLVLLFCFFVLFFGLFGFWGGGGFLVVFEPPQKRMIMIRK